MRRGREAYGRQAWRDAHEALGTADASEGISAEDLERFATSAYMLGRESEYLEALERAHSAHLESDQPLEALRCAFWIGVTLASSGEIGSAGGWLARAQRLLEREGADRVERGYLLLPRVFEQEAQGDLEGAAATAAEAAQIGEDFADPDLFALAAHEQGHVLIRLGRLREGVALLDMAMVAVIAGEVSPISSGIVYCGVILACEDAHELRRAQEWTAALSDWCEHQPDLVAFTGRCLVHRAQIMRLKGDWERAIEEAERAAERCTQGENPAAAGQAHYQRGEIHRMLAEHRAAESAYRDASRLGRDPQPGLSLLRLAQGKTKSAAAAIRRVATELTEPGRRAGVLPAYIEIMLAAGDLEAARQACEELRSIAETGEEETGALAAMAAQAQGAVALASGDAQGALGPLRRAAEAWEGFDAPYERARARELVGLACRRLGDEETAVLELEAASQVFADLGAATDLSRLGKALGSHDARRSQGLTKRELEVLTRVAAGETNKAIATQLVVSVRTVDRHVSNIYAKLGVSSRAAATAYAHEHDLI